jgi:hypothetical protein
MLSHLQFTYLCKKSIRKKWSKKHSEGFNYEEERCQSDFVTVPPKPLQEPPAVVLLWGRPLGSWLLALDERDGHDDLCGSGCLIVIPYVHRRTELYWAQAYLA